jgi:2-polyprenyl-6-methoxyphenol hydroxylase-like FAD-dependent oxidoreductase
MRRTTKIAVIGAGLGGMTVAGLLQRYGFSVKVYEQAAAFSRIGAGIHLSSNVMVVMRRLGIEHALSAIGLHPDAFVSRQWDTGAILFELPLDAASEARYGAAYINVHRGDLHAALESALAPGTIAFGRKLAGIDPSGSTVRLAFADGDRAEADLVIGADGLSSKVREFLLGPEQPRYTGHIAHRAIFPTALLNGLPIRACTKWWGPGNHILVYYMTQTREEVYIVTSAPQPEWTETAAFVPCDRDELVDKSWRRHPRSPNGRCSIASRSTNGAAAASSCWAMLVTRCGPTWRRAPPWPSRMRRSWRAASPRSGRMTPTKASPGTRPAASRASERSSGYRWPIPGCARRPTRTGCSVTMRAPLRWSRQTRPAPSEQARIGRGETRTRAPCRNDTAREPLVTETMPTICASPGRQASSDGGQEWAAVTAGPRSTPGGSAAPP